jgi:NAD-dependent dihydropyrimidine dehydrogenase PreA subunit
VNGMKKEHRSIPREEIPWFPTIDAEKCTGCGTCADFCQHGVYELDGEKAKLSNKFGCIVGCTGCLSKCPEGAISFPDQKEFVEVLRRIRAERG